MYGKNVAVTKGLTRINISFDQIHGYLVISKYIYHFLQKNFDTNYEYILYIFCA